MEEIAISKFKATCLAVLESVRKTRKPIRVTKFGRPVAEVVPPAPEPGKTPWIGPSPGTARIAGDIIQLASVMSSATLPLWKNVPDPSRDHRSENRDHQLITITTESVIICPESPITIPRNPHLRRGDQPSSSTEQRPMLQALRRARLT